MPKMKFEQKENMSRTEAAARLSAIADALGSDAEFELERGGEKLEFNVPDQVRFELEVEIADIETPCSRTVSPRTSASTRLNTTYAPLTTTSTTSRTALFAESTNEGRERPKSARRTWPLERADRTRPVRRENSSSVKYPRA
jgi:amphi-Trp domain-containing protein